MKKLPVSNLLENVLVPLAVYLAIGLMIFSVMGLPKEKQFLLCGIIAGIIFAVKDIVENKIVTFGIGVYCIGVAVWLLVSSEKSELHLALLLLIAIASLASFRYLRKYSLIYMISGYGALLSLIVFTMKKYEFSKFVVCLVIFIFLNAVSETMVFMEKKKTRSNSLVLVYGIVAMLAFFAPVFEEPYDWKFVANIATVIKETVQEIASNIDYHWRWSRSDGIYRLNFTGYSDTSDSLLDSLLDSEVKQLALYGRKTKGSLYLKGNVTNRFTGDGWTYNLKEGTLDISLDMLLTMYTIFSNIDDMDTVKRFVDDYEYELVFGNLKTSSLFYPLKTIPVLSNEWEMVGDNWRLKSIEERGYSYRVKFLDLDYANPSLISIIQNSKKISYKEEQYQALYDKLNAYFRIQLNEIPFQQFVKDVEQGEKTIREKYTVVDDTVSESVRSLAQAIVKKCDNDYEKCKALENFFSRYHYNKEVDIPSKANVLDWFLFDGMEGYCTHFSTALVQMLRSVGVPARMAEGFLVDYTSSEGFDSYIITGQNAHAWTEAYIEGFGWIRLDATVSDESENPIWFPQGQESKPPHGSDSFWNDVLIEEELEEIQKEQELIQKEEEQRQEERKNLLFSVIFIGGMTAVILFMVCIWFIYQNVVVRRSKNPNVIFGDIMKILAKKYRAKEESETVREYFHNIKNEYDISEDMSKSWESFVNILEQYWYGEIEPTGDIVEYMKSIRSEIKKSVDKK